MPSDGRCAPVLWLYIRATRIGDTGAIALAEALTVMGSLVVSIDLDANYIGDPGAAAFARAIASPNSAIAHLHLSGTNIGDPGV